MCGFPPSHTKRPNSGKGRVQSKLGTEFTCKTLASIQAQQASSSLQAIYNLVVLPVPGRERECSDCLHSVQLEMSSPFNRVTDPNLQNHTNVCRGSKSLPESRANRASSSIRLERNHSIDMIVHTGAACQPSEY